MEPGSVFSQEKILPRLYPFAHGSALVHQVSVLMNNHILHTDLHPGNVLVDQNGTAYILDFDKTRTDIHDRDKLRHRYKERWHRAVMKYRLPEWLDTLMADSF